MAWRLIVSPPADGPTNMAADEALLDSYCGHPGSQPILRLYNWTAPCLTIGYFQKYAEVPAGERPYTRRMTGGLTVVHGRDLSYCMIAGVRDWPSVYDQSETYRLLHTVIARVLRDLGIEANAASTHDAQHTGSLCVETVYEHDVLCGGRKIVGSCQRRRGETILVQGSIHVPDLADRAHEFARQLAVYAGMLGADTMSPGTLSAEELSTQTVLAREKYGTESWNRKF